ncbi:MAG: hypothetical protein ACJAV5_000990 [Vicingaceae bacterium]|jgi:hypothetical protein
MSNKNLFSTFLSLAFICCLAIINPIEAQNISINADGSAPDNSAMLDVSSTNGGLLIPRMTFLQRTLILSPANSLLIYQTDNTPGYYFNSGTATVPVWTQLSAPADNLGNHIAITNIQLGTNFNQIIDNRTYAYFLKFTGEQNTTDTRLYGAKITYTVTEAD